MNFKSYLISKKNLLIAWFTIHSLALFVNFFNIEGKIIDNWSSEINLFCTGTFSSSENFWPFVKFFGQHYYFRGSVEYFKFEGLFYEYDISEFIAYSAIIFLALYISFNSKNKQKETSKTES